MAKKYRIYALKSASLGRDSGLLKDSGAGLTNGKIQNTHMSELLLLYNAIIFRS